MDLLETNALTVGEAMDHWYYRGKYGVLRHHLRRPLEQGGLIADVGCGIGIFLKLLRRDLGIAPERLMGIDSGFTQPSADASDGFSLLPSFPSGTTCEVILLMDVLEHCADDFALVQEATTHLKEGGFLFITVPAFQWLWSAHDVFLKHYRRYNHAQLRRLIVREPSLQIVELHYFYGLLFPLALGQRLMMKMQHNPQTSGLKPMPAPVDSIFRAFCAAERGVMQRNRLLGLSTVAVAQKRSCVE